MHGFPTDLSDDNWAKRVERRELRRLRRRRLLPWMGIPAVLAVLITAALLYHPHSNALNVNIPLTSAAPPAFQVDQARPFDNTPAANWASGAAGIVLPAAAPIGRYSAAQVESAMTRAQQLIVLERLDPHVLETGDAEPVLALLAPGQVAELRPKLTPGNESQNWWVTAKIAPGFRLLPAAPRINGDMSPALDKDGELTIKTNYIVAYAFSAPDPSTVHDPMDIIVVARQETEYTLIDDSGYDAASQGMWFGEINAFTYAGDCAWFRKGFLAPSLGEAGVGLPVRPTEQYFDPTIPLPTEHDC
ncbi:hypothetical protein [Nocardia sp. NPDC006630]|uniref:hypothetical protein n=1 Tax=Nocardia sp. NPDC006630 TaxID=3157181 RepID=UPI0033A01DDC